GLLSDPRQRHVLGEELTPSIVKVVHRGASRQQPASEAAGAAADGSGPGSGGRGGALMPQPSQSAIGTASSGRLILRSLLRAMLLSELDPQHSAQRLGIVQPRRGNPACDGEVLKPAQGEQDSIGKLREKAVFRLVARP